MDRVDISVTTRQIDIFPLKQSCKWHMSSHPALLTQLALSPVSDNILSLEIVSILRCILFTQAFQFLTLISVIS